MAKYEYKFVEVPKKPGLRVTPGVTFEECKKIIQAEAAQGWRLKQIVTPFLEQTGAFVPYCYQIIFEREV